MGMKQFVFFWKKNQNGPIPEILRKNIENRGVENLSFSSRILWFFFCFIPMKISQHLIYSIARMGRNDDYPGLHKDMQHSAHEKILWYYSTPMIFFSDLYLKTSVLYLFDWQEQYEKRRRVTNKYKKCILTPIISSFELFWTLVLVLVLLWNWLQNLFCCSIQVWFKNA